MSNTGKINILIGGNAENFYKAIGGVQNNLRSLQKDLTKISKDISYRISAPLALLGGVSVHTASQFSDSITKVRGLTQASTDDFNRLKETAKEFGANTAFSASQVADGMQYLALAGYDTNQILQTIPATLNLASSAGGDLASVTDILTDTMSAYSLEADKAGEVSDILAKAQATANTSVLQLGEAYKMSASNASSANQSLEDTTSILMVLADAGLKGSMAGTTVTAMLRDLKKASNDGAVSVGGYSVALYNIEGNMRSLIDIMRDFETATKDMTQLQKDSALSAIFQEQAIRGVNTILNTGTGSLVNYQDELANSSGFAKEFAELMEGDLGGALRLIRSSLESVAITIGEHLTPYMKALATVVNNLANWFNNLSAPIKIAVVALGAFLAIIPPTILGIASMIKMVTALGLSFTLATGGITLLVGAVVAGVTAIVMNWDKIKEWTIRTFDAIKIKILEFAQTLLTQLEKYFSWIPKVGENVKQANKSIQDEIEKTKSKIANNEAIKAGREGFLNYSSSVDKAKNSTSGLNSELKKLNDNKPTEAWLRQFEEISRKLSLVQFLEDANKRYEIEIDEKLQEDSFLKSLLTRKKPINLKIEFEPVENDYDKAILKGSDKVVEDFKAKRKQVEEEANDMLRNIEMFSAGIFNSITDGLAGIISGDVGLSQFFGNILSQFGDFLITMGGLGKIYGAFAEVLQKTFLEPVSTIAASIGMIATGIAIKAVANNMKFGGSRAEGGSVNAGMAYRVGERGAEMFVPNTNGTIIKTSDLNGSTSAIQLQGKFRIEGSDLVYILNKENTKRSRIH
ncbi:phage tail tape measure protein [Litoribacter alkaliphilus]|uniref:Phage tail tape measure protein n=1 Tax=Litoribacter ruber TaxID=702568 RepID=A0AAP2CL27_9BACT|nr:phage tail tape measure protein [Litoribacter alkaliphilus]MBS9525910.1 phage tail tape measure protein [Litoribacter alkaliphilus]